MVELIDVVLEGFKAVVDWVTGLFMEGLRSGYESLSGELFGTPTPQTSGAFVFGTPSNRPWPALQDALVGGEVMLLSLLLLVICVQARHTVRIFNIGSAYDARRTRKTAWVGAFLIVTWYWIGVLGLYLVDGFTVALLPDLDSLGGAMLAFLRISVSNPALSLLFALVGGFSMWALEALYFIREILLYVYLYGMPIAFALAFGNIPILSDIALGFSKRFVPLAVLPLPAAVAFKGYDLLYSQHALAPNSPFVRYLVAVALPLLALYLTWKTFEYATPLTAKVLGGAAHGVALVGGVAAGASVGGASVAATAAQVGPKAAAGQALVQNVSANSTTRDETSETPTTRDETSETPTYRRTEHDPGIY